MTDVRARYWPGNAAGLHREGLTVLVDVAADSPLAQWLTRVVQEGTALEPLLDLLFENGIASAPDFAIVAESAEGSVVVARGTGRVRLASGEVIEGGVPFVSRTVPAANAVVSLGDAPVGPTLRAFDGVLSVAGWRLGEGVGGPSASASREGEAAPASNAVAVPAVEGPAPVPAVPENQEQPADSAPAPALPDDQRQPADSAPVPAAAADRPDDPFAAFDVPASAAPVIEEAVAPEPGRAERAQAHEPDPDEAEESAYLSTYRRLLQPDLPGAPPASAPSPAVPPPVAGLSPTVPPALSATAGPDGQRTEFPGISLAKAPLPPTTPQPASAPLQAPTPPQASAPPQAPAQPAAAPPGFIDSVPFGGSAGAFGTGPAPVLPPPAAPAAPTAEPGMSPFGAFDAAVAAPFGSAPAAPAPTPATGGPVPIGGQSADGRTVSRAGVARAVPPQTVVAKRCPNGHLTQANAPLCRVCGAMVPPQENQIVNRPVLGRLVLPTGEVYPLDRAVVLGRDPQLPSGMDGELPHLVRIVDPRQEISGQHALVSLDHWNIEIMDLGSTNGTEVEIDGRRERLVPKAPVPLRLGARIVLAEILEIRVEAAP